MSYLIFDTETTGFPSKGLSRNDPKQARICQLAFVLLDKNFKCLESYCTYINPDGWRVSDYNHQHGTTQEKCETFGVPIAEAMQIFEHMVKFNSTKIVAYNIKFDAQMIDIEHNGVQGGVNSKMACAMEPMTAVCKLPSKRGGYKFPKLIEAYEYLFKEQFNGAHDALADVVATARVFKWLVENRHINV